MITKKQKLIDKYIGRIKVDYPEDDKLMIDLQQFAEEIVKLCNLHGVMGSFEEEPKQPRKFEFGEFSDPNHVDV